MFCTMPRFQQQGKVDPFSPPAPGQIYWGSVVKAVCWEAGMWSDEHWVRGAHKWIMQPAGFLDEAASSEEASASVPAANELNAIAA